MNDEEEIRKLIGEHFEAMNWDSGSDPDWDRFREDFLPDALLFGAARPVQARTTKRPLIPWSHDGRKVDLNA